MEEAHGGAGRSGPGNAARVEIGGWTVNPVALSLVGPPPTGMWGAPAGRAAAIRTIVRAVELGVELIEVPVPFGPWADLVRDADPEGVVIAARLTGPVRSPDEVLRRLGPRLDVAVLLAEPQLLDDARAWGAPPVGVVAAASSQPSTFGTVAAVRGPWPAAPRLVDWCAARGIPYLAPAAGIVGRAPNAIALLRASSPREAERVFAPYRPPGAATPPAAGPG